MSSVFEYDATKGQVHVEHAYPVTMTPTPRAVIDVNLVLETFQGDMLENGRWINVIGYVKGRQQTQETSTGRSLEADLPHLLEIVLVQAVLVWDAGAMRVDEYEKTVEAQREVWRKTRHLHENMKEGRSR